MDKKNVTFIRVDYQKVNDDADFECSVFGCFLAKILETYAAKYSRVD